MTQLCQGTAQLSVQRSMGGEQRQCLNVQGHRLAFFGGTISSRGAAEACKLTIAWIFQSKS